VSNPELTGSIVVQNGALLVAPLERRYTDIHAEVVFNNRYAEIRSIHAFSGGPADITGRIDFPELGNPQVTATLTLNKFRPFGVDAHTDAATSGEVRVTGALLRPTITGGITISDGDVPVMLFAGGATFTNDLTDLTAAEILGPAQPAGMFSGVTLDNFKLRVERGTWFDLETSRAELAGELTINKQGDDMRITGTLEGSRGTYVLEAGPIVRRLEVTHAEVRFLGTSEINPAIDITARRVIFDAGGRQMDVEVRVGGTLRNPTLSLASADAAAIPQDELLSFLLFGQPSQTLGGTTLPGEALLQETLVGSLSELATLEIENAIGAPFDIFQLRLGGGGFGGLQSSALVMGTEVTRNVFLTVEYGIAALFGETGNQNSGTFAARLEWRVDRNTSVRMGYEPADRTRLYRGLGVLPISRPSQQGSLEIRRRWQW
jgi:autotransporter translocation and assembly factor TamB